MISIMNEWKIETPVACAKSILSLTQVIAWLSESLVQGLSLTLDTWFWKEMPSVIWHCAVCISSKGRKFFSVNF